MDLIKCNLCNWPDGFKGTNCAIGQLWYDVVLDKVILIIYLIYTFFSNFNCTNGFNCKKIDFVCLKYSSMYVPGKKMTDIDQQKFDKFDDVNKISKHIRNNRFVSE